MDTYHMPLVKLIYDKDYNEKKIYPIGHNT